MQARLSTVIVSTALALASTGITRADDAPLDAETKARVVPATNGVIVSPGWGKFKIWLSPELVSFAGRVSVIVNGKPFSVGGKRPTIQPSVATILEDVRTRGDRQHPFWAKVEN